MGRIDEIGPSSDPSFSTMFILICRWWDLKIVLHGQNVAGASRRDDEEIDIGTEASMRSERKLDT